MNNFFIRFVFLFFLQFLIHEIAANGQQFYRFCADVSVKDKLSDGKYRLTMGKVYYDKIYKKIVYDLKFPEKEQIIIQDTSMFTVRQNEMIERRRSFLLPEFTVFHLALTGKLSDYGLAAEEGERSIYKIGSVEKTDRGVVTTWMPTDEKLRTLFGDIKMLKKNRRLDAMLFYDKTGRLVSRQFFKNYVNVKGVDFPTEVTMISYGEKGEKNLQQTTYKNIVIDQQNEDEMYRFRIPITGSSLSKSKP